MKHFKVRVTEVSSKMVDVKAATMDEALAIAKGQWDEGHIIIDSDCFDDMSLDATECCDQSTDASCTAADIECALDASDWT